MVDSSLDVLASNGIINFDADAYVKGTTPRFAGSPGSENYLPGEAPLTAPISSSGFNPYMQGSVPKLNSEPPVDAFVKRKPEKEKKEKEIEKISEKEIERPKISGLATIITVGLAGALALLGGSKLASFIKNKTKVKSNTAKTGNNEAAKDGGKVKNFFTRQKDRVTSWFKSKNNIEEATKNISEKAKGAPKWLKASGIALASLLGLFGLYKFVSGHKHNKQVQKAE